MQNQDYEPKPVYSNENRPEHNQHPPRKRFGIVKSLLYTAAMYAMLTFPNLGCRSREVTLETHKTMTRDCQGWMSYAPIREKGYPLRKNILVVPNGGCLDNARDKEGNRYHFFMVQKGKSGEDDLGVKALLTDRDMMYRPRILFFLNRKKNRRVGIFVKQVEAVLQDSGGLATVIDNYEKSKTQSRGSSSSQ
ncbi:MAG: hypothetical protein QGH47_05540 [Candidatus Woesearchaeota archaeon]|jgi:hypothetical protein|nr:hypothetical protein [Candidatus Woesearchaeota archaeon]